MRVLVCGDRNWTDRELIYHELSLLYWSDENPLECVIDGHATGADQMAHAWTETKEAIGIENQCFPAQWRRYGRGAGPIRNQQMLDQGRPDLVLAFHDDLEHSKGTAHMVRIAQKAGIPVRVVSHDT